MGVKTSVAEWAAMAEWAALAAIYGGSSLFIVFIGAHLACKEMDLVIVKTSGK